MKLSPISISRAPDGTPLANYQWNAAPGTRPPSGGPGTPSVYLLHGLGEHAGRYGRLVQWLTARGWRVGAHDHRGHGRSGGRRAALNAPEDLVTDAVERLHAWSRAQERPPILLGHSLEGLVAVRIALQRRVPLEGLVLSSPPFVVPLPGWARRALTCLSWCAPGLPVRHGLATPRISHDAAIVADYHADQLVHGCITGRLARFVDDAAHEALRDAPQLPCRTLLLVAGDDGIVAAQGSRRFADRAPAQYLTLRWYDSAWHEIFNEINAISAPAYADLGAWLAHAPRPLPMAPVQAPEALAACTT